MGASAMAQEGPTAQRHGLLGCSALVVPDLTFLHVAKVQLQLHQPLIEGQDISRLATLCAIADAHVERAIRINSVEHFDESVLTAVEQECNRVRPGHAPTDTLKALRLFQAFPYLEQGLTSGTLQAVDTHAGSSYLSYVSVVNQLVMMATQIYHDACQPAHHKYTAHQLALLYQCLNQLQGDTKPLRRLIEARFEEVKGVTESNSPVFDVETSEWLQEISWLCREEAKACPPYVHKRLHGVLSIIRQDKQ